MHRFLLGLGCGDKRQVDHENRDGLDNRRDNLRVVTHQQNGFNRGAKGYSWFRGKCQAHIKVNGKNIHLGYFDTPAEAHAVYLDAKQKHHRIGGSS